MKKTLLLFVALILGACHSAEDIDGLPRATEGFVVGKVTRNDGTPVAGAAITVTALDPHYGTTVVGNCTGTPHASTYSGTANGNGDYSVKVFGPPTEFTHCITVQVVPPPGSGLAAKVESGQGIYLKLTVGYVVLDTLRIDITL